MDSDRTNTRNDGMTSAAPAWSKRKAAVLRTGLEVDYRLVMRAGLLRCVLNGGIVSAVALLSGCAAAPAPVPLVDLAFIQDGVTSTDLAIQKLGVPSSQLAASSGGKVLMFQIGRDAAGLHAHWYTYTKSDWYDFLDHWAAYDVRYSLVLVFDQRGVLERHALVKLRAR
jgi:hypothetical protein